MNWSYIAGFFDGEGTVAKNGYGYRIAIPQTNKEVIEKIKRFAGSGGICVPRKRRAHWKDSWIFFISKQKDVSIFLKKIYPFLIVKKKSAEIAIKELEVLLGLYETKKLLYKKKLAEALKLRQKGLSYWRIGKEMGKDRGYIRRLILRGSDIWCP